jgi:hypothetical protein
MAETTALVKGEEAMLLGVEVDVRRANRWSRKGIYRGQGRMATIAEIHLIEPVSQEGTCLILLQL